MANFTVQSDNFVGLTPSLNDSIWNIAVDNAPYRTGNLRAQIKRAEANGKRCRIFYNTQLAPYLEFLEAGQGRVKKYKGFIENDTVNGILGEVMQFITSGETTYTGIPTITLRTDRARNYERKMLKGVGLNPNMRINAFERATLGYFFSNSKNIHKKTLNMETPLFANAFDRKQRNNRFITDVSMGGSPSSLGSGSSLGEGQKQIK